MMHTVLVLVTAVLSVSLSVAQPDQGYDYMVKRCKKRMPLMPRYKGLMMRAETKALLRDERVLKEVYEVTALDDYATFDFPATCSTKEWTGPGGEKGVLLGKCTERWLTEIFPPGCCKSRLGFIAPMKVCPTISNKPCLNVIQKQGAFQLFQVGMCETGVGPFGQACGAQNEGGCREDQRLENVLVDMNGETVFVPVLLPNQCICVVEAPL